MTNAELNKRLAELLGYGPFTLDGYMGVPLTNDLVPTPNYAGDLNAVQDAVLSLPQGKQEAWSDELFEMMDAEFQESDSMLKLALATAAQRTEALIRTLEEQSPPWPATFQA